MEGVRALTSARKLAAQCETKLEQTFPRLLATAPNRERLHHAYSPAFGGLGGQDRVATWFALRRSLDRQLAQHGPRQRELASDNYAQARDFINRAANISGQALLWFKDVSIDFPGESTIEIGENKFSRLDDLLDSAHELVHRTGDIRGGLFGCRMAFEDGFWYKSCPVHLAHIPLSNSMGFTARHECNICHADASECEHISGQSYRVKVFVDAGRCSVCGPIDTCPHTDQEIAKVVARAMMADMRLHEVSLVTRPRDPLARITRLQVADRELLSSFGRIPAEDSRLLCHTCMYHCSGLKVGVDPLLTAS